MSLVTNTNRTTTTNRGIAQVWPEDYRLISPAGDIVTGDRITLDSNTYSVVASDRRPGLTTDVVRFTLEDAAGVRSGVTFSADLVLEVA